jgi:LuxR family transcriptional regulator, maltose regulon positive regulatory protein
VVALDVLLLDSKLSVPRLRLGSVSRAGLIEAARASDCKTRGHLQGVTSGDLDIGRA